MKPYLALTAIVAFAPQVAAQQVSKPDPADPAAPASAVRYESAFTGYRGYREEPLAPWRSVNDDVARAGGHVGILRGAHGGHAAPKPAAAPGKPGGAR